MYNATVVLALHLESVQKSENPHLQILPGLTNGVHSNAVDDSTHRPVRLGAIATSSKATRSASMVNTTTCLERSIARP